MGWLDSITGAIGNIITDQEQRLENVVTVLNPFDTTAIKLTNPLTGSQTGPNLKPEIQIAEATGALAFGGAGALTLGGGTIASTATAAGSSALSAFQSSSTLTKGIVLLAAPAAATAVIRNPSSIPKAAGAYTGFENDLANAFSDPSLSSLKTLATQHPLLTAGTAVLGAGAIGGGIAAASSNIVTALNTSAVKKNTNATLSSALPSSSGSGGMASAPVSQITGAPNVPTLAAPGSTVSPEEPKKSGAAHAPKKKKKKGGKKKKKKSPTRHKTTKHKKKTYKHKSKKRR